VTTDARVLLRRLPGLSHVAPDVLDALAGAARRETFAPGTSILTEGAPVPDWYGVVDFGAVQIQRLAVDAEEVVDYLADGDVLDPGTPGLPAAFSALTTDATECLLVSQALVNRHRGRAAASPASDYRTELALFVRTVGELVKGPPVTCPPEAEVAEAARLMTSRGVGSVAVVDRDGAPIGIVTDRDLRAKLLARGLPSTTSVASVMSAPLLALDPRQPAFDALLEMTRRGIHHMGVVADGRLTGIVSSHDIILVQGAHPVALVRQIEQEPSLDALAAIAPRVVGVVKWLAQQGASAYDIGRIVTEISDRLVHRALSFALASLEAQGHGRPPVPYAWLAAGSEGRREQTLKTDQDNALVYADPAPELATAASGYFGRLAGAVGGALVRLGFPECEGGFMAANPRWCQPESVWRARFDSWMETPHPEPVLHACIFFDLRPVAGDLAPGLALWDWVCERAPTRTLFLRHMAKAALERHPPLGLFGGFTVERSGRHKGAVDLKARGLFPMTQALRVCALSLGVRDTNTVDRLLAAGRHGLFAPADVDELRDACEVLSRIRLEHQLACLDAGRSPDNFVDPRRLRRGDRALLKQAFEALADLQRAVRDRFHVELVP
jgi:CBS domain-containing protein